ncbi:MAG TPA: NADP-dependent isocitrate dehydrogenase [Anaerolineaceae bacterium]|nr:NADP-dependent isocitrate dehydrogenase [Anaerolineaceae bacterium]HPN51915.1 NADP-dependent isocitrate dehydrogenase [Anaerolineaceae bacterium]
MNPSDPTHTIIQTQDGRLSIPARPFIPYIPGDGIGPEIWAAARSVMDQAVARAYGGERAIQWLQVQAGEAAFSQCGEWLPSTTLEAFKTYRIGIKGPLTTPVGGGIRSLNVALRKDLDLYVCLRPVRYFEGIIAPVREPQKVDITLFRENTEDLYAGIEFAANSPESAQFLELFSAHFPQMAARLRFTDDLGLSLKPVSRAGSERLVRAAMQYAVAHHKPFVTLVHKGNIMKFTEGAFRSWGYDLVEREFSDCAFTSRQSEALRRSAGEEAAAQAEQEARAAGKIIVNDVITDAAFQKVLLNPEAFSVIATTNLNGDYLSDALAAQIGGIGIAPGANINYNTGMAVFEATHGTAPGMAGKNLANPSSLILSGEMMLRYMGWTQAADILINALAAVIKTGRVTADLALDRSDAHPLGTHEFGQAVCAAMS